MKSHKENPVLLDLSFLSRNITVDISGFNSAPSFIFNLKNQSVDLRRAKSCWWRRPQLVNINPLIRNSYHRAFAMAEWRTALQGIWNSIDCLWVNNPQKDSSATHKPYQLTLAKRIGLSIPETLITSNPDSIEPFWQKHSGHVIFKVFSAFPPMWRETRPLRREFLQYNRTIRYAPVIFQEYINDAADIRITIIGNEVFAAETRPRQNTYQYDFRMSRLRWKEHKLPADIENLVLKFMRKLGLEYGAIDMKLRNDGEYFFLEINPAGQFLFIEFDTGLPITNALALHLVNGTKTS